MRVVAERVAAWIQVGRDRAEHVVDEREQRRDGAKADRNRRRGWPSAPQRLDECRRIVQDADIRIAKAVDRLLAIADDEDGGREASAAAPKPSLQLRTSCDTSSHCARLVS